MLQSESFSAKQRVHIRPNEPTQRRNRPIVSVKTSLIDPGVRVSSHPALRDLKHEHEGNNISVNLVVSSSLEVRSLLAVRH